MFKPKPCQDCGPHAVLHRAEYVGAVINEMTRVLQTPTQAIWQRLERLIDPATFEGTYLAFLKQLERLGIGTITNEPHPHESSRTRALREEAERRNIDLREFRIGGRDSNHFIATWQEQTTTFEAVPRPQGKMAAVWMDEKDLMRKAFLQTGIPVARGEVCSRWKTAVATFHRLEKPFIIKPHTGSRSRHTTIHIETLEELEQAFTKAKRLSPWVILEEELVGSLYRGTVVGGKALAVVRRDAPQVIGNGRDIIRQLREKENALPIRHAGVFEPIPIDGDTDKELARQQLHWNSIPAAGHVVILNPKFGRGQGSLNEDVTDVTHPDNIILLETAARVINDPLIGFDFILSDISRSWKEQPRAGIIECNSAPFLDIHHYPYKGTPRNIAGPVWELVFPGSEKTLKQPNVQKL
ncbi:hypothetical protein KBD61_01190 [Patescibacteria group bacterium]|nr:hypothetical protein [Patescibacteria group bacterium]MBP9709623.1 hypothetical protein [Patescibacteria group bacterium]